MDESKHLSALQEFPRSVLKLPSPQGNLESSLLSSKPIYKCSKPSLRKVSCDSRFSLPPSLSLDDLCLNLHVPESYEVKNKFPPHLKELLTSVAYHALDLDEYDEHFFARLPSIFPYNKFTLTKLVKREVFQKRMNDYTKKQDELLEAVKKGIKDHFDEQKKEFELLHAEWEKGASSSSAPPPPAPGPSTPVPPVSTIPAFGAVPSVLMQHGTGAESPAPPTTDGPAPEDDKERESVLFFESRFLSIAHLLPRPITAAEPKFKFRFNENMRSALYWACDIEDKKSTLIEEKQ